MLAPRGVSGAVEDGADIDEDGAADVGDTGTGRTVRAGREAVVRTAAEDVHAAVSSTSAVITNRRTGPPSHTTGSAPGCRLR